MSDLSASILGKMCSLQTEFSSWERGTLKYMNLTDVCFPALVCVFVCVFSASFCFVAHNRNYVLDRAAPSKMSHSC